MPVSAAQKSRLNESLTFQVKVVPNDLWWSMLAAQDRSLPWHETVLRPILQSATEAWAYELPQGSAVHRSAGAIVTEKQGKFALDLSAELIHGHELFWNASGGKRGSIVIVSPLADFPANKVFPHCYKALVVGNPNVAHSPSALRFAKAKLARGNNLVCVFPRNNGFEYFDLYASQQEILPLFAKALALVPGDPAQNAP
ncbi:MAG: hypothetical protein CFE43_14325 [Burkholderiales bacterium PBB3]|nr:MAG: hypothetical protein CFE43_14325 [Burkholderiales bacterium PBB3]